MPRKGLSVEVTEKLIELVRDNSCIYDVKCVDYRDAQKIHNVWESIARAMEQEHMKGEEWKKKWRNLRDMYIKKKKETRSKKSGQAAEKARRWQFLDMMSFLDEYSEENCTVTNVPPVESSDQELDASVGSEDDETHSIVTVRSGMASPSENSMIPSTSTTPTAEIQKITRSKKRRTDSMEKSSSFEHSLTEFMKGSIRNRQELEKKMLGPPPVDKEPEDESCALRMRKMSSETKSYLQLQISTLFVNAENQDKPALPIKPLPQKSTLQQNIYYQPTAHAPATYHCPPTQQQSTLATYQCPPPPQQSTPETYQCPPPPQQSTPATSQCTPPPQQSTPATYQCPPPPQQYTPATYQCPPPPQQSTPATSQCTPPPQQSTPATCQCPPPPQQYTPAPNQCLPPSQQPSPKTTSESETGDIIAAAMYYADSML